MDAMVRCSAAQASWARRRDCGRPSRWPPSSCGTTMACPLPWDIPRPRRPPPSPVLANSWPISSAGFLAERLTPSKLDLIDAAHFTWEDGADDYAALVAAWWGGGYADRPGPGRRWPDGHDTAAGRAQPGAGRSPA